MDRPDSHSPQPGASPIKAFLIILALIILTTVIFLMTANGEESPDTTRSPSTNSTPDFSLTDEEAIVRFTELNDLRLKSYFDRDVTLIDAFVASDSELRKMAYNEITDLLRDKVLIRSSFETRSLNVITNTSHSIVIEQLVVERPKVITESGKDITTDPQRELRTIEWTLVLDGSEWKVFDALVTKVDPLGGDA